MRPLATRRLASVCIAALLGVSTLLVGAAPAEAATYKGKLRSAVKTLKLASENNTGYDRDAFTHWVDNDGDSCDARAEVLIAEAVTAPTVGSGCSLTGGSWRSYYDGVVTGDASSFDVDHMVPLAEAWGSGARSWNASTRQAYANDLGDGRTLVAVTASSNRSKSDRDPAQWMPRKAQCRYVSEYVAVKIRWSLTVDRAEKRALTKYSKACKNKTLRVQKAPIGKDNVPTTPSGSDTGLRVDAIAYDPPGTDTVEAEYVLLRNEAALAINVSGWSLQDDAGTKYAFPSLTLAPGATVKVVTGSGANTAAALYAGSGVSWWNNDGDVFKLYNPKGSLMQIGRYTGAGDGSIARF